MIGNEYLFSKTPMATKEEPKNHNSPTDAEKRPVWKSETKFDSLKKETGKYLTLSDCH